MSPRRAEVFLSTEIADWLVKGGEILARLDNFRGRGGLAMPTPQRLHERDTTRQRRQDEDRGEAILRQKNAETAIQIETDDTRPVTSAPRRVCFSELLSQSKHVH